MAMNEAQDNALSLSKSHVLLDPVTYLLATQVVNDAQNFHQLNTEEKTKLSNALVKLQTLYQYALKNYKPVERQSAPDLG